MAKLGHKLAEQPVVGGGDHDLPVGSDEGLEHHYAGVAAAVALRVLASRLQASHVDR